jgi:ankyrin repeat protein
VVEYLVARGADLNYTGFSEGTALMLAASAGESETVRYMLELGAAVNLPMPLRGETALHHAAQMGRIEATRLLLTAGADPNAYTVAAAQTEMYCGPLRGETALHFAAAYGVPELVEALLAAGADRTIPDHYGDRPAVYLRRHQRSAPHFKQMLALLK